MSADAVVVDRNVRNVRASARHVTRGAIVHGALFQSLDFIEPAWLLRMAALGTYRGSRRPNPSASRRRAGRGTSRTSGRSTSGSRRSAAIARRGSQRTSVRPRRVDNERDSRLTGGRGRSRRILVLERARSRRRSDGKPRRSIPATAAKAARGERWSGLRYRASACWIGGNPGGQEPGPWQFSQPTAFSWNASRFAASPVASTLPEWQTTQPFATGRSNPACLGASYPGDMPHFCFAVNHVMGDSCRNPSTSTMYVREKCPDPIK